MRSVCKAREVSEHTTPLRGVVLAIANLDLLGIGNPLIETLDTCRCSQYVA